MKKFAIILLALCFTACDMQKIIEDHKKEDVDKIRNSQTTLVIDGCEYIETKEGAANNRVYSLTHKGNCSSKVHSCKK